MAASIVSTLSREIHDLKQRIDNVDSWVSEVETSSNVMEIRVVTLEESHTKYQHHMIMLQLSTDDGENCSRRNNIKLRGIQEATARGNVRATVTAIFNLLLDKSPSEELELDQCTEYRDPLGDASLPRDVIARVHFYTIKEEILRGAWARGPVDFDGVSIHLSPDLSRLAPWMQGTPCPLLEVIRRSGVTYYFYSGLGTIVSPI